MGKPWGRSDRKVTAPPLRGKVLRKLDKAQKLLWLQIGARPSQSVTLEYALDALIEKLKR